VISAQSDEPVAQIDIAHIAQNADDFFRNNKFRADLNFQAINLKLLQNVIFTTYLK